ncbi:hypothetical protein BKA93DRAFT_754687, partial [Sparassis latifolia]
MPSNPKKSCVTTSKLSRRNTCMRAVQVPAVVSPDAATAALLTTAPPAAIAQIVTAPATTGPLMVRAPPLAPTSTTPIVTAPQSMTSVTPTDATQATGEVHMITSTPTSAKSTHVKNDTLTAPQSTRPSIQHLEQILNAIPTSEDEKPVSENEPSHTTICEKGKARETVSTSDSDNEFWKEWDKDASAHIKTKDASTPQGSGKASLTRIEEDPAETSESLDEETTTRKQAHESSDSEDETILNGPPNDPFFPPPPPPVR